MLSIAGTLVGHQPTVKSQDRASPRCGERPSAWVWDYPQVVVTLVTVGIPLALTVNWPSWWMRSEVPSDSVPMALAVK